MIIRGGNNVHATDVEHALVQHDAVKEVAVVGAPHPVLGEDVVAFVVLHPGAAADAEDLRAFGLEQLADYKVPRQFVFVDELPAQRHRQGGQARAAGPAHRHAGLKPIAGPTPPLAPRPAGGHPARGT